MRRILAALSLLALLAGPAIAADLASARAAGQVGERPDGLLALVDPNAPADVKAMVGTINAQREAEYRSIAARNGTPVDAVRAVVFQRVLSQLPPGSFYMDASGRWVRK